MSVYRAEIFEAARNEGARGEGACADAGLRLATARRHVDRIERQFRRAPSKGAALRTGFAAVDAVLPDGGLTCGAIHESLGLAARRFAVYLLARRLENVAAPALWAVPVAAGQALYGPGLAGYGVDPSRLVIARYRSAVEGLWLIEEALKSGAFSLVLGEPEGALGTTAARRLSLASEAGGTCGLLVSEGGAAISTPGTSASRWRSEPAPAAVSETGPVRRRLSLVLERCRGLTGDEARRWLLDTV